MLATFFFYKGVIRCMENGRFENRLGLLIISLLRGRSLSMRKLSAITDIDTATISAL